MKAPRALLFDLDGTLVDSRGDIAAACNAALVAHGRSALTLEAVSPMIGDGARLLITRALAASAAREGTPPGLDHVVASFHAYYVAHPCVLTTLLPGAREVLGEATRDRLPCALITNKPREVTLALLEALGLSTTFAAVWAGGDGPLKPAPDGLRWALARLGVAGDAAWMIGDGPQDVGAGKAAGCVTVGIPGIAEPERLIASGPDLTCASLHELRAELARVTPA